MLSQETQTKLINKKMNTCKHYNGSARTTCLAGVNYEELTGGGMGWARRLPCYLGSKFTDVDDVKPCALRQFPTEQEAIAEVEEIDKHFNDTVTARQAIIDYLKANDKPTRNVSGRIPCPICNGTLQFGIAYNGHCHGHCSTQGCVSWME